MSDIIDFAPGEKVGDAFADELRSSLPAWYRPIPHLVIEFGCYLAFILIPLFLLGNWRWFQALMIPAAFLVGNVFEWWLHKDFMHVRRKPYFIYDGHTKQHHRRYLHTNMAMRDWYDLPFVNFGLRTLFGVLVSALLFAGAVSLVLGRDPALLFLSAEAAYIMLYEFLHLSFHRPKESWVWKLPFIRWLAARHTKHHDPRRMRTRYFNVTFPLSDWLFGTAKDTRPSR